VIVRTCNQPHRPIAPPLLRQLAIGLLVVGIFLRTYNLGDRPYWVDEVTTSIRVAGYTKQQVIAQLADGQVRTVADLQRYQQLDPNKGWSDTWAALVRSPEHAPLYFLLARLWSQLFGSSVVAMRSLSVLLSVLALPCMLKLGQVLFGSVGIAQIALCLFSISPFFVAYAQEARPYSLWVLVLLGQSVLLLRALRGTSLSWLSYSLSAIVGLYTSLLTGLVLLGHGVYVAWLEGWQFTRTLRRFLVALTGAILLFVPWLWVIVQHWRSLQANTTWMREPINPLVRVAVWLYSLALVVFDVPVSTSLSVITIAQALIALMILSLIGFGIYELCTHHSKHVWLFVLMLFGSVPLGLMAIDSLVNGQASATPRYLIPSQLASLLAMAAWLGSERDTKKIRSNNNFIILQSNLRRILIVLVLAISLYSCIGNLDRSPDYQKEQNRDNAAIAAIINQAQHPLLIAEAEATIDLLSLSHQLLPSIEIQILPSVDWPLTNAVQPGECRQIFLMNPSSLLQQTLQQISWRFTERYRSPVRPLNPFQVTLWQLKDAQARCDTSSSNILRNT
jgi:uncharacterized membrane protein